MDALQKLCEDFKKTSKAVWEKMAESRDAHHQIGEESITDELMIKLKKHHSRINIHRSTLNMMIKSLARSSLINISSFTKFEEGGNSRTGEEGNGADYEVWFTDSTNKYWIGYRIQAKILNFEKNKFNDIRLNIKKDGKLRQIDKLVKHAEEHQAYPIYNLYLQSENLIPLGLNELYGCSIISAQKILDNQIDYNTSLHNVVKHVRPWHTLICPGEGSGEMPPHTNKIEHSRLLSAVYKNHMAFNNSDYSDREDFLILESPPYHLIPFLRNQQNSERIWMELDDLKHIIVIQELDDVRNKDVQILIDLLGLFDQYDSN